MKWGHDQLQNDLAAHLSANSDRMVWTNMQLGPSGSPRPDVYTAPKSYSKFMPIAYEVKVSVADFRSDITSGKWQSYLQFASGVTFAVPAGLITKADLPKGCGLIIRGAEGWTTVKAPTLSPIHNFPREAMIKLLIDGIERAKRPLPSARLMEPWKVQEVVRKKYGQELAEALAARDTAEATLIRQAKQHEVSLEAAKKRHDSEKASLREILNKESVQIDAARADFCKALGLESGASIWDIKRAASDAIAALNKDQELARMRQAMENARSNLQWALGRLTTETHPIFEQADIETAPV